MSNYKYMRLVLMFDLPMVTKKEKRIYNRFRKDLINDGFERIQLSVYSRFCNNSQDSDKHIARIKAISPSNGNIRILNVTENQYEKMIMITGKKTATEMINNKDLLITIE